MNSRKDNVPVTLTQKSNMKKFLYSVMLMSSVLCIFNSCDKLRGDDDDTGGEVITDPALIGVWNVNRYEALDNNGAVVDTETDPSVITETYNRFVFDNSGLMQCWRKDTVTGEQAYLLVYYWYYSDYGSLYFGDTGEAVVSILNDTSLVFESTSFAPLAWYQRTDVSLFRVYCTKQTE